MNVILIFPLSVYLHKGNTGLLHLFRNPSIYYRINDPWKLNIYNNNKNGLTSKYLNREWQNGYWLPIIGWSVVDLSEATAVVAVEIFAAVIVVVVVV